MYVRAPLLGRRGVSVRSTKTRVFNLRSSDTMSVSEGLLDPAFCTLRVKKDSRSKGSASWVLGLSADNALAPGFASRGGRGVLGKSSEWRVSLDDSSWMYL